MIGKRGLGFAFLLHTATLVACNNGATLQQTDPRTAEVGQSTSQTISSAGGTLSTASGSAKLSVPPGALSSATDLSVLVATPIGLPQASSLLTAAYNFGPDGTQFAAPVNLAITLPNAPTATQNPKLAWLDSSGVWQVLTSSNINGTTVSANVSHFTNFAVLDVPEDGSGCQLQTDPDAFCAPLICNVAQQQCTTPTSETATLKSLNVNPTQTDVAAGTSLQLTASATYSDGSVNNVTSAVEWSSSNSNIVSVINTGLASSSMPGKVVITATLGSLSATSDIVVTLPLLTGFALSPNNPTLTAGLTSQMHAVGTYTDGSTADITSQVSWNANNTTIALFDPNTPGLLHGISAGTTVLTGSLASFTQSTGVTVTQASLATLTLTPSAGVVAAGLTQAFTAAGTYTDGSNADVTTQVSWSSSNNTIATVSNTAGSIGVVTGVALGSATITAMLDGVTAGAPFTVSSATLTGLTVTPATASIAAGLTQQYTATGSYSDGTTLNLTSQVVWTSSSTTNATISNTSGSQGLVYSFVAGASAITATLGNLSGSAALTVQSAALTSLAVTPTTLNLAAGLTQQFTATGNYSDGTTQTLTTAVTWASSNMAQATIGNSNNTYGLLTAVAAGNSNVTATLNGVISNTATLTVAPAALVSLAVTPGSATLAAGYTQQFIAVGTYTDNSTRTLTANVNWAAGNASNASVSNSAGTNGLVTGLATGSTTITATLGGIVGQANFTVTAATLSSVAVTPATPAVAAGFTQQFAAVGTYSDGTTHDISTQVSWTSSNTTYATVSNNNGSNGLVSALVAGTSNISASLNGQTGSTLLTVSSARLISVAITPQSPSLAAGYTQQFTAVGNYSDGTTQTLTTQVTWASSNTAAATVSNSIGSAGLLQAVEPGSTTLSATLNSVTGNVSLNVSAATLSAISITPATPTIAAGLTQQFTATGTYSDNSTANLTSQVVWASSNTAYASVSNAAGTQGLVSAVSMGNANINATLNGISGVTLLTVSNATLTSLSVTPSVPSVAAGLTQQFTATGVYSDNSTQNLTAQVTWASANTGKATISNAAGSQGLASTVATGSATISASYNGISGSTQLNVTNATLSSINVTPATPSVAAGLTQQFTATGVYSDTSTQNITTQVTWTSSNPSNATVSNASGSQGLATTLSSGSTTIGANLNGVVATTVLSVSNASLTSINVTPATPSVAAGMNQQLTATGTYSDNSTQNITSSVTWASSNTAVATISNAAGTQGLTSTVAAGNTTLSATLGGITGSTVLTATSATLASISVTPATPTVAAGLTEQFTATGTYTNNSTQNLTSQVTWSSSNPNDATISNAAGTQGHVTTLTAGNSTIGATLNGVSGNTTLAVTAATLSSIGITPVNTSVAKGTAQQFTAIGTFSDNTTQNITSQVTWSSSNTADVTISNASGSQGLANTVGTGSVTIGATLNGINATAALTVTNAALSAIGVTPASPSVAVGIGGNTEQFTATGVYTDSTTQDLTTQVTWASSDTSKATISNAGGTAGLASMIAAGNSNITASYAGIVGSSALTVSNATLTSIGVTPSTASIPAGFTQQYVAIGTYSDGSTQTLTTQVTWASSDNTKATISNANGTQGLASMVATGSVTLGATLNGVTGSRQLTVSPATLASISVTPATPVVSAGNTQQFAATGTYSDGTTQDVTSTVTWSSSVTASATVSNAAGSNGLVTTSSIGSTNITAALNGVSGSTTLSVSSSVLTAINVTPTTPSVAAGNAQQFTAIGTYSDSTTQNLTTQVTWSSTNTGIATISNANGSKGLATSLATGSSTIGATLGGISGSTTLTVSAAVLASISLTPSAPSVAVGLNEVFTATGIYSDASTQNLTTQVTWNSNNLSVASISNAGGSQGHATAVATGASTISASYNGIVGSTTLTVSSAVLTAIGVTPASQSVAAGETQQFTATGTYSDGSTHNITTQVTWASSDTTQATISNANGSLGLATTLTAGATNISATLNGVSGSTPLTVTAAVLSALAVTPATPSQVVGNTSQFTATGTYSDGTTRNLTTSVTWSSGTPATATISNASGSQGLATMVASGSTSITATYSGITGTASLTVTPATLASIAVTPANPSLPLGYGGNTEQFTATGTYSDGTTQNVTSTVTWSSSQPSIATISNASGSQGLASTVATGATNIFATLGGITGHTDFIVSSATLTSISVTPATPTVAAGNTQQFMATGTYSDASTQNLTSQVTWNSSSTAKATISNASGSNGLVTTVAAGATTIAASLGGVSGSTSLTVSAAALTSIGVTPSMPSVSAGNTQQFTATGVYSNGTSQNITTQVTWASSSNAQATISNAGGSEGLATTVAAGSSTISASLSGVSNSTTLSVTSAVLNSISVTPGSPTVAAGNTQQFTATGAYSDGSTQNLTTQVTWSSSDSSQATISNANASQGLAMTVSPGVTNIDASFNGITGSTVLQVSNAALSSIAVTPATPSVALGNTQQFTALGTYTDGTTQNITTQVTWASATSAKASISNANGSRGLATTAATGTTSISATLSGVSGSTVLTVTSASLVSIAVTPNNSTLAASSTLQYTATGTYSDGTTQDLTTQAIWSSSQTAEATISNAGGSQGLATGIASGATNISAVYSGVTGSTILTVQ